MSPRRMTTSASFAEALAWLDQHRPSYDSRARQWLLDPLARALRAGVDPELVLALVQGAELALETDEYRRRLERGEQP